MWYGIGDDFENNGISRYFVKKFIENWCDHKIVFLMKSNIFEVHVSARYVNFDGYQEFDYTFDPGGIIHNSNIPTIL